MLVTSRDYQPTDLDSSLEHAYKRLRDFPGSSTDVRAQAVAFDDVARGIGARAGTQPMLGDKATYGALLTQFGPAAKMYEDIAGNYAGALHDLSKGYVALRDASHVDDGKLLPGWVKDGVLGAVETSVQGAAVLRRKADDLDRLRGLPVGWTAPWR